MGFSAPNERPGVPCERCGERCHLEGARARSVARLACAACGHSEEVLWVRFERAGFVVADPEGNVERFPSWEALVASRSRASNEARAVAPASARTATGPESEGEIVSLSEMVVVRGSERNPAAGPGSSGSLASETPPSSPRVAASTRPSPKIPPLPAITAMDRTGADLGLASATTGAPSAARRGWVFPAAAAGVATLGILWVVTSTPASAPAPSPATAAPSGAPEPPPSASHAGTTLAAAAASSALTPEPPPSPSAAATSTLADGAARASAAPVDRDAGARSPATGADIAALVEQAAGLRKAADAARPSTTPVGRAATLPSEAPTDANAPTRGAAPEPQGGRPSPRGETAGEPAPPPEP